MKEKHIVEKLLNVQKEIGKISKSATNPFYKSKYADLNSIMDVVKPLLSKHDLLITQPCEGNKVYTIISDHTGDFRQSFIEIPANITDPQKFGSAITYFRRYTLQSLLALQADDDDGNLASKKNGKLKSTHSEITALIKNGDIEKARNYLDNHLVSAEHKEQLTNHFKN